ncbi:hypothetical protein PILCRDRAFT_12638 [Piloderma croceum F 1598]|uniref:UBA domain-containing protein n=1 Tax=Piloderma croceum (strain F 1598) TaxID=765440 RepID=A0A0C3F9H0_PILCF|nr:hypothetical protein PILCRDRAFT_12638 [Piloderma croceum F 1598]
MADSFADLWNSSAPTKPTPPPQKLGSVITSGQPIFAAPKNSIPKPPPTSTSTSSSSGDAFSNLLSGSLVSSSSRTNMTIAQRAALVEKERTDKYLKRKEEARKAAMAWDGIDSLGLGSTGTGTGVGKEEDDDWSFGFGSVAANGSSSANKIADDDDWGLEDFVSAPTTQAATPTPHHQPQSLLDLDEFTSLHIGDREDRLLPTDSRADEDDILGVLSKPVDSIPKRPSPTTSSSSPSPSLPSQPQTQTRPSHSRNTNGTSYPKRHPTPPPHILGQLVEMGFSIQQAKDALGATQSGVDVQGALEVLLAAGAGGSGAGTREEADALDGDRSDDVLPKRRQRPPQHRIRPSPPSSNSNSPSTASNPSQPTQPLTQLQIQEQADKLLAQASEIGLSVLSRANAFWKEGKERARGIYEERGGGSASANTGGSGRGANGRVGDGRPRWMQDNVQDQGEDGWRSKENGREGAFVDDFDGSGEPKRKRPSDTRSSRPKPESQPQQEVVGDLFGDAPSTTTAYVSPFRRGNRPKPLAPAATPSKPHRPQILASPTALATATTHKQTGTQHYKLGQYSLAESSYTSAISSLPPQHLLLVPLYNNRALTRIKIGDMGGAVEDCSAVVGIVGDLGDLGLEGGGRVVSVGVEGGEGVVVDLGEGLVKALRRRAEAWEGKEKWEEAGKDWEVLAAVRWVAGNVRGEAVRGAGRCRRMMASASTAPSSTIEETNPNPKPKPKPPTKTPTRPPPKPHAPSQALKNLHSTLSAQESEDQQRLELKDSIDVRLQAWKGGKETNIRALIASLETVLWPELGWQKVSMAEVVSPGQVKVRYTKAIAKLHPDKLNVNNTTLEQRMIANGVFGALNEAWNAFKQ